MRVSASSTRLAFSILTLSCLPFLSTASAQVQSGSGSQSANGGTQTVAALGVDWSQAANDDPSACDDDPGGSDIGDVHWIGSILQQSNSIYLEGMGVPERLILTEIPATTGNVHTLEFKVESSKANVHAYDFLISWQQAQDATNIVAPGQNLLQQLFVNRCLCDIGPQASTAICNALHSSGNTTFADLPVPGPVAGPNCATTPDVIATRVAAFETQFPSGRTAQLFGDAPFSGTATCNFLGYDQTCGDTYALYNLVWTSASTSVAIEWAGHLARSSSSDCAGPDPGAYDAGFGASNINGGPYHFKLDRLDGASLGNRDNQIKGADIQVPPPQACAISPGDAIVCQNAAPVNFTATTVPLCVPGITYAWTFTSNTSGATFCSATNLATVCVNPGPNAGGFTLQSTISNVSGSVVCTVIYTVVGNTTASALTDATVCEGGTAQFCTTAGGTGPFTYSWTKNGVLIGGATGSCYTTTAGSGGTVDTYCVTVAGACGTPPQRCATLTASTDVAATALSNATVCEGGTNQFCTTASGTGPFTYSWTKNGAAIPGATGSCYTATAGSGSTVDTYCVTVAGACGTPVQRCANLTAQPNVTATALDNATVCEGTTNPFCTTAGGTGPFTYSWTKNGAAIPGATASCYTATAGSGSSVDTYCVTVSGSCGAPVQRCANLTAEPNVAATALDNATVCEGLTNQFCTTASGTGPFTYSWTKNGAAIPGATASCYTATAGSGSTVDTYCVTVSGTCGTPVQRCASLTAQPNVAATPLGDATVCDGLTNQFCTTASGTGPFTYSWTKNTVPIAGATGSCYTATAGSGGSVDTYCVTVSGDCGSPVQRCATLTATANTTATPLDAATVCEGTTNQFCTTAGGAGPFTYSWTKNGAAIPGATASCYTATAGSGSTVDTYCVDVAGACGAPAQRCATLTAQPNVAATALDNATVCEGLTNQFCTTASGTGPFTYSWTKNGVLIGGATGSCYTATAGSGSTVDTYCVTVAGTCGTPVQRCATLTAQPNVAATALSNATVCAGLTHQFCTTASGTGPFTYSWTKNSVPIAGATDSCYTATAGGGGTVDTYCVDVAGTCGSPVQRCATLTATNDTTASALNNASACEGLTHPFCTTAGGTGPFSYSWTKNGAAIPGATGSCYTATAGGGGTVDTYCVTVTGLCGPAAPSCATLTANFNNTATPLVPATLCRGQTNQFCTTAGGTGPFTYSWTKNGVAIPGATSSCYTATAGTGGSVDTYCVTVDGACGTPAQQCATLTANYNTRATALTSAKACEGETHQFCTTPHGTGPFTFSWKKNGAPIPGATSNCYTATAGSADTVDNYCVTVSGACGPPVERCADLSASPNLSLLEVEGGRGCPGDPVTSCATALGTGPFTYQWSKNGVNVPGATDSCFSFLIEVGDTQVCCTVTGGCGPPVTRCGPIHVHNCSSDYLTLTQGGFGDSAGSFNGQRRPELILQLLQGGMTVGKLGVRSLTFAARAEDAASIIQLLPGSGPPTTLPAFGDETLDDNGQTSPLAIPLGSQGQVDNAFLAQAITLSLNLRLSGGLTFPNGCSTDDADLGSQELCHTMVSMRMLPGPDACVGTADDVPDLIGPDGDPATPDNLRTLTIPQVVLDSLASLGLPHSVNGLVELGNRALADLPIGTASIANVNEAMEAVNNLFDEGRSLVDCSK